MADMPAEDALNNNETVKRYICVSVQRRKSKKCWTKCVYKFLKCYKTRIFGSILCAALITATFFKAQSESLPPKKPNKTKTHVVELKPMNYDHAGKNINKLQQNIVGIRENQRIFEDEIRLMHRTLESERADIKQDGGYVNTEQANRIINKALQLYDPDAGGVVDYACLYTGASILAAPDTYNLPLCDCMFLEFHIRIIYSQPPELITPDVTPGHYFAFWGNGDQQITRSQPALTIVNAPEAGIEDQKILAPRTFVAYGFEHPRKISTFNYDIEKESTQTFAIPKRNQIMAFANVEPCILDKHGHNDLTCVYRVRVYGNPH